MIKTTYQKPEIRDANDNIIQQGAFGKNTALANATNDGWIDYVANDLEFLYDLAKDEIVPVPSLPASGQMNKTYLLTTTGVSYRWSGTEWVAVSSSEAVGRAEAAANLAEQWATKTDGTVDGTEYSAKYYAQQAQQSADDAQDVADDMADHLVQIDKNTGGVAKNSKRISNVEKLLQGNLYDYQTDTDTAYTKTVPAGAMPYAGIEKIGGKTLVWNQLQANTTTRTISGVVFTYNSSTGELTISEETAGATRTGSAWWLGSADIKWDWIAGHKYLVRLGNAPITGVLWYIPLATQVNLSAQDSIITTVGGNIYLQCAVYTTADISTPITFRPQVFDLTLMFGAGNEPTVEEFEAMFPADYYPYNAGALLSAGVTEVVSVGKNLCNFADGRGYPDGSSQSTSTKRIFELGKYVVGIDFNNNYSNSLSTGSAIGDTITVRKSGGSYYGVGIPFRCKPNTAYTISADKEIASGNTVRTEIAWYMEDGTYIDGAFTSSATLVQTAPSNAHTGVVIFSPSANHVDGTVTNIQIEEGSSKTAYEHYINITLPVPAEVQALTGYGWSAGGVSNYVDFERKVYVQNVDRVDLGSKTWASGEGSFSYAYFSSNSVVGKKLGSSNMVCPLYVTAISRGVMDNDKTIAPYNATSSNLVVIRDDAFTDATELKTALNGVYMYYELATPVETDISQYLTDNIIEVGAGGKLTFENSNGDDYHIPVPSDVTYMIDLQEAVSNG